MHTELMREDAEAALIAALEAAGASVRPAGRDAGADLSVALDGIEIRIEVKALALVDEARALLLVRRARRDRDAMLVVVADRVVSGARPVLTAAGIGWFDRRGHLSLRGKGLVMEVDVPAIPRVGQVRGVVPLAVAVDLLLQPRSDLSVRATARRIEAAPSSVSAAAGALREIGLLEGVRVPDPRELFWWAAERWKPSWVGVDRYPHPDPPMRSPALRLGLDDADAPGWALTGDSAAVHLGAAMGVRAGAAADFYVPDGLSHRLAVTILGKSTRLSPPARLAVAPVAAACRARVDVSRSRDEHWPLTRPLFIALDLARDPGRGREILERWDPVEKDARVW